MNRSNILFSLVILAFATSSYAMEDGQKAKRIPFQGVNPGDYVTPFPEKTEEWPVQKSKLDEELDAAKKEKIKTEMQMKYLLFVTKIGKFDTQLKDLLVNAASIKEFHNEMKGVKFYPAPFAAVDSDLNKLISYINETLKINDTLQADVASVNITSGNTSTNNFEQVLAAILARNVSK